MMHDPPADAKAGANGAANESGRDDTFSRAPAIGVPSGGGAIRGIGEKFTANPVTGTASLGIQIHASPGRSGFTPEHSLAYDSGAGNGPFGFGWSLALPAITRKTEKGLPRYLDAEESDVFVLSGSEDLVPELMPDGTRFKDTTTAPGHVIDRYRPRVEGLFARIERWTRLADGDVHWRSLTKDNILTLYGKDDRSRIAKAGEPAHIFCWCICETRDDKGNAIVYEYKAEDAVGVDLSQAHERNRGGAGHLERTVNRYLKRIRYGNRHPFLTAQGTRPQAVDDAMLQNAAWMFEVVLDYGEHDPLDPKPLDAGDWLCRHDPFSSYRSGFEIRTSRLCQRILMFHHFADEAGVGDDCLVRSTDFVYRSLRNNADDLRQGDPIASFIASVSHSGYKRLEAGGYLKKSLPPLEFEYSNAVVGQDIGEIDSRSLENLPAGVDGSGYQWLDLDGEGLSGILAEQGYGWFYKRNESALTRDAATQEFSVRFAQVERVGQKPAGAPLASRAWQFLDLNGDGRADLVALDRPVAGFYERTEGRDWGAFRSFHSLPNLAWDDPRLKFIDLTGDGFADALIAEDEVFTWYESLAERGFGPENRIHAAVDDERGPRVAFTEASQTIYLADMSGDGLSDIVRIRNGEVCYWPNLGYGRFGAKISMDGAPRFDTPDQFEPRRIRLADIDGSGGADIIYLGRNRTRLWFNQSGNSWGQANDLTAFPAVDNVASVTVADLFGNGTSCLVWSTPLPGARGAPMKYLSLMAEGKPHLLVRTVNNLGAETRIHYAPSTHFYLRDKYAGRPWITRLPFPVQTVERVETYDHVNRNRFVTRYAYHHGYFDGVEREFRGFGMVEQWDSETLGALRPDGSLPAGDNFEQASHSPPVHTKTWFHTGVYLGRGRVSDFFAGLLDMRDTGEYYREPAWRDDDAEARKRLLADTVLPSGLTAEEEREACRALKGAMLRREVYALDGTGDENYPSGQPYTVSEQNFTVEAVQRRGGQRHAIFFTHPREAIEYHYERNPADPRVSHTFTLEVDAYGAILRSADVSYPRADVPDRQPEQNRTQILLTLNRVANRDDQPEWRRVSEPVEMRSYEVVKPPAAALRFTWDDVNDLIGALVDPGSSVPPAASTIAYDRWDWRTQWNPLAEPGGPVHSRLRLVEHLRTLYRPDDLGVAAADPLAVLPLGVVESMALPGESYRLAFPAGLLANSFQRPQPGPGAPPEDLLAVPADVLAGPGSDRGGYVDLDQDGQWWMPTGRVFYSPDTTDTAAQERALARQHFFLPRRYRDPFHTAAVGTETIVTFDVHDLLMVETRDALDNRVTAAERNATGVLTVSGNDYRVLKPRLVADACRNRTAVAYDALGFVVGTAVMGKPLPAPAEGDSLDGFSADLDEAVIQAHLGDPFVAPQAVLQHASTRLIYDLFAYHRTKNQPDPQPAVVYTLARETHAADPVPAGGLKFQHRFSYSDGFGREIQKKIQAEPGPVVADGPAATPRWVSSGWTVFNNKGKPVRQYEPFFSITQRFEFGVQVGVSPILFYDPVERMVATLHPNHTYEKVVFDPWRQVTWDVNDTVLGDPRTDADIQAYTAGYFASLPASPPEPAWETWYAQRQGGAQGALEQAAAAKAAAHAGTPATAHFDTLGRPFLTLADNGPDPAQPGQHLYFATRVELDVEGNRRVERDAVVQAGDQQGRIVMRYGYDMLGNRIRQFSMEAGARWTLSDVTGKPIRTWDSRGHSFRIEYDPLRRPLRSLAAGIDAAAPGLELLVERLVYGEQHPEAELRNLRGTLYLHLDQAGSVVTEANDFKANPLRTSRRLTSGTQYRQAVDWRPVDADHVALPDDAKALLDPVALEAALAPRLEADAYLSSTSFDALNRPVALTTPHTPAMQPSVIRSHYNEASLLQRVDVNLRGASINGELAWTVFAANIDYDAKGQRQRIDYGNGASTFYNYDPLTFRLVQLLTRRDAAAFPGDCPQPPPAGSPGCQVQNLHYTYDPGGNIVHIQDDAQQRVFFDNKLVEPSADYTYDAVYRLVEATGREHLGQIGGAPIPHSHHDALRSRLPHPGNGDAMGSYVERYVYDAVGNFLEMQHRGSDPVQPGWTRAYAYGETSLIEDGTGGVPLKTSNRLTSTMVGLNPPLERYVYDAHGNTTRMPHLGGVHPDSNMHWDYRDQLRRTDLGGGGTAYYVYDATGQRIRKVWEKSANLVEERVYLGGFEIYRRRQGAARLERETLHVMDGERRMAVVETRTLDTAGDDPAPPQLIRYQFGNHLGSASLELDDQAQIISYEEYTPFGSTAYQAVRSQTETAKRYRYTGKERDEETGFEYHKARYCAPWLGRWTSCDPTGLADGHNLYAYVRGNPIVLYDPTGHQGVPTGGITVSPNSKISAKQFVEMIQKSEKIPAWMKKVFSAQGNRIMVKSRFNIPAGETQPEWFKSTLIAIQSKEWHLTTGAANVSKENLRLNDKLQGDHEPGDTPAGGPKSTGIIKGETIDPHSSGEFIGKRKMVDHKAGGGPGSELRRPATDKKPAEGLIIVANRYRSPDDPTKEAVRSDDAILETFFHEIGAHAGQASQKLDSEHGITGDWLNAPITEADKLAKAVHEFFNVPSEDALIESVTPAKPAAPAVKKESVWDRARRVEVPKKESVWDRARRAK